MGGRASDQDWLRGAARRCEAGFEVKKGVDGWPGTGKWRGTGTVGRYQRRGANCESLYYPRVPWAEEDREREG